MKGFLGISALLSSFLLTGCFANEEAIAPYPRGAVSEMRIDMGASYAGQYFFNLDQNKVVKTIDKTSWDIAFSSEPGAATIRLNTGKNMYAAITDVNSLDAIYDTVGLNFVWDWSNGKDDSTALWKWEESNKVVVINLGLDHSNQPLGFVKVLFELQDDQLKFTYSDLSKDQNITASMTKDEKYSSTFYSFASSSVVEVEPIKTSFDLIFRQYIYYFEPEDLAYLVVGALINSHETRVAKVLDKDFEAITIDDTLNYSFETKSDVIGYDWKEFKISEGIYVVYANQNYLIEDSKGFIYKLHFTDFYSTSGERGYPKMEYKRL